LICSCLWASTHNPGTDFSSRIVPGVFNFLFSYIFVIWTHKLPNMTEFENKVKNLKYHTVRTFLNSNWKKKSLG
jgi:hypothetical protein